MDSKMCKRKRMKLRLANDGKVLIRTYGYGNLAYGILRWKFSNMTEKHVTLELELGPVRQKTGEGCYGYIERMPSIEYLLDPNLKKVIRAKRCYETALIHEKEKYPIIFSEYSDFSGICSTKEFLKVKFEDNRDYSRMRVFAFYPWSKQCYPIRVKNIYART